MMIVVRMLKQIASAIPAFSGTLMPSCALIPAQNTNVSITTKRVYKATERS